jgi:hypothetical protein
MPFTPREAEILLQTSKSFSPEVREALKKLVDENSDGTGEVDGV